MYSETEKSKAMETKFLNNHCNQLIIFFAGCGMDWLPLSHLKSEDHDVIIFFNYTSMDLGICKNFDCEPGLQHPLCPIHNAVQRYRQINVIAFGSGVWAASAMLDKYLQHLTPQSRFRALRLLKKIKKSIAVNGTLCPVSNIWGIPQKLFNNTLKELEREVASGQYTINNSKCIRKYCQRMCGNDEIYEKFLAAFPNRALEDVKNELSALKENYVFSNAIFWNRIIIGNNDITIPAKNQQRFWREYELGTDRNNRLAFNAHDFSIEYTNDAHFPFFNWNRWEELLEI